MSKIVEFAHELGVTLYDGQRDVLESYLASGKPNLLLLAGRRSGKSLLSDILVLFDAIVGDYSRFLMPGEPRYIVVISTRLDSAVLHTKQCARLLRHSKELRKLIVEEKADRLVLRNGVTILSLPASARSVRGYGCSMLVLDEAAFFVDVNESNQSADEILTAAEPTMATFDGGRVVITTSPSAPAGLVHDLHERKLDNWHVVKRTTQEMNPKVTQAVIDRAMARDEESARAEYFAEWRASVESFLRADLVDAAIEHSRAQVESAQPGVSGYVMGVDPATLRDNYGLLVAHAEKGRVIVDYAKALKPPIDLVAAEELVASLAQRFHVRKILCDTASTTERLRGKLPAMEYCPFSRPTKLRCFGALKEAVNLGDLSLPGDVPELVAELKALRIKNGNDIAAPTSGRVRHDDLADCLALCCDSMVAGGHVYVGRLLISGGLADYPRMVWQSLGDGAPSRRHAMSIDEWNLKSEQVRFRDDPTRPTRSMRRLGRL